MSSESPIADISKGATKALLDFTSDKIDSFIEKFKKRDLAFIRDKETIDIVREEYSSGEAKFYESYVEDRDLLLIVRMGLALRRLESTNEKKLHDLRERVFQKYKVRGLHIAEFVQVGILNRYIGILIGDITSLDDFKRDIKEVLENIEKHVLFVKSADKTPQITQKASNIVNSHSPNIFVVAGMGPAAKTVEECSEKLEKLLQDYEVEKISRKDKEVIFFKRKP